MHYLFFDESYAAEAELRQLVMAAWAVDQDRFNRNVSKLPELYRTPVLDQILHMLNSIGARAVVARTMLQPEFWRVGEVDATTDIPSMARTDNVWSACSVFLCTSMITDLIGSGEAVGIVDVHYDAKDLKPSHKEAIAQTLRDQVVSEAKALAPTKLLSNIRRLRVRRFEKVPKVTSGQQRDKFQMGTWVADRLCANFGDQRLTETRSMIRLIDMTEVVRRTTQQFDGKSYNVD
jgi:hypothetical protein